MCADTRVETNRIVPPAPEARSPQFSINFHLQQIRAAKTVRWTQGADLNFALCVYKTCLSNYLKVK